MSREATELFIRRVKQSGYMLDLSRGNYGEWLDSDTRTCWYFWYQAWRDRAKSIKRRRACAP